MKFLAWLRSWWARRDEDRWLLVLSDEPFPPLLSCMMCGGEHTGRWRQLLPIDGCYVRRPCPDIERSGE